MICDCGCEMQPEAFKAWNNMFGRKKVVWHCYNCRTNIDKWEE